MRGAFLMMVCAVAGLPAQSECPNNRAVPVAASTTVGPTVACGSGVNVNVGGIQVNVSQLQGCPLLITVIPAHDRAEHDPKSWTDVKVLSSIPAERLGFTCDNDYFIFIPIGSSCVMTNRWVFAQYPLLTQFSCPRGRAEG